MTRLWKQFSPRERLLIIVACALFVILLLSLVVIRPVIGMRNDARAAFDDAIETNILVSRAAAAPNRDAVPELSSVRTIKTNSAAQTGIVVERISTDQNEISVTLNDVEPARLYGWLARLESNNGIVVSDASIRPTANGEKVTATVGMRLEAR